MFQPQTQFHHQYHRYLFAIVLYFFQNQERKVLSALFTKAKDSGIVELKNLFDMVLPEVTTDLTQGECYLS